jgi:hypothetical protein
MTSRKFVEDIISSIDYLETRSDIDTEKMRGIGTHSSEKVLSYGGSIAIFLG